MKERLSHVDGLRAIALISFLLYHVRLDGYFSGGFTGVDVFFVISGYVVALSIVRRMKSGKFSFRRFILSRIFRLMPALFVVLFVSSVFGSTILLDEHRKDAGISSILAALSMSNIRF